MISSLENPYFVLYSLRHIRESGYEGFVLCVSGRLFLCHMPVSVNCDDSSDKTTFKKNNNSETQQVFS